MNYIALFALVSGVLCGVRRHDPCGSLACDKNRQPVCGSDGVTYGNLCFLKQAVCRQMEAGNFLDLAYEGTCRSTDTSAAVKPVASSCTQTCDSTVVDSPICGTDGVTYANKCTFLQAQCKYTANNMRLEVASIGRCGATLSSQTSGGASTLTADKCASLTCDSTQKMPICGTDGQTYQNKCFFLQAQCKMQAAGQRLEVAYLGTCRTAISLTGTGTISGGSKTDPCEPQNCDSTPSKICGSHGTTFASDCEFQRAVCKYALSGYRLTQVRCSDSFIG